jgi:hypothetical protein
MKTYKQHLISTSDTLDMKLRKKPILRSSAIFPVLVNKELDAQVLFLSYWLIKRDIPEVSLLVTLRSQFGEMVYRNFEVINEIKSYVISVKEILRLNGINLQDNFEGSIELEVFSTRDLVFPYPAFVLTFVSKWGASAVHTTGRIFNDMEDVLENTSIAVPESGFDIVPDENYLPYLAFVNGFSPTINNFLEIEIINSDNESVFKTIHFDEIKSYETKIVYLMDNHEKQFLKGKKGTAKIKHNLSGFFPRFNAGNISLNKDAISLTHTYYDTSLQTDESAYWENPNRDLFHDSAICFPVFLKKGFYNQLAYYPIYAPQGFKVDFYLYDKNGRLVCEVKSLLDFEKEQKELYYLDVEKTLFDNKIEIQNEGEYSVYLTVNGNGVIPARLKFGLNCGMPAQCDVPTNICFTVKVSNDKLLSKPATFKWSPIINHKNSVIIFTNSSFVKNYNRTASLELKFWSKVSNQPLIRTYEIAPYGLITIDMSKENEVKEFLNDEPGWVTANCNNPFIDGWYFEVSETGFIGGDHSF